MNDGPDRPDPGPISSDSSASHPGTRRSAWARRPPPRPGPDALTPWQWELTSAEQLSRARAQLRREVFDAGVPPGDIADAVERLLLAFEELASNGFRHGDAPVVAAVTAADRGWLIDVTDAATDNSPTPAVGRDPAFGGLGLHLIAQLSNAHGWSVHAGRKHVRASIGVA